VIVVHCSATPPDWDIGVNEIDRLHAAPADVMVTWWRPQPVRGRGWSGIGYHKVIRRDGSIEVGRRENQKGAHARGFNHASIAVCLIGGVNDQGMPEENFNKAQYESLRLQVAVWSRQYQWPDVMGHGQLPDVNKACPSFDLSKWLFYATGDR